MMGKKDQQTESKSALGSPCCRVEAVVSIDERGQMVLPKEIREKAQIGAGDKLAIVSWMTGEKLCCISLMKTDNFAGMVKEILGPMMKEIIE